jgi:glycosyltransferase involved in cell wall biosynthesis
MRLRRLLQMGKEYSPLVSIITPILNNVQYLKSCIETVLNQTYPNVEHIFIDGGSTDGTKEMLAKYNKQYPDKVRFISEVDECRDAAANKGIRIARGEIFGALGSDDLYEPDAIQAVIEFFGTNPDACFVYGTGNYIDEKGRFIKQIPTRDFSLKSFINGNMFVNMTSTFYKREVFERVGLLYVTPEAALVCDTDFVIRVGRVFTLYRIEKVLSSSTMHHWKFSGDSWVRQKLAIRNNYFICKKNGASILSWASRTYYQSLTIDWLRPVLGFTYPFIEKMVDERRFRRDKDYGDL